MRAVCIVFVCFLLTISGASAGDYIVAWGFDGGNQSETGKAVDCEYKTYCKIKLEKPGFELWLSFWHQDPKDPRHGDVSIGIESSSFDCCFLDDGVRSVQRSTSDLIRLRIYKGHARKGNEFVQNRSAGNLYLGFSDMK